MVALSGVLSAVGFSGSLPCVLCCWCLVFAVASLLLAVGCFLCVLCVLCVALCLWFVVCCVVYVV